MLVQRLLTELDRKRMYPSVQKGFLMGRAGGRAHAMLRLAGGAGTQPGLLGEQRLELHDGVRARRGRRIHPMVISETSYTL